MKTYRIRPGIETTEFCGLRFERCDAHGKGWREGGNYESAGGSACQACINAARPVGQQDSVFQYEVAGSTFMMTVQ